MSNLSQRDPVISTHLVRLLSAALLVALAAMAASCDQQELALPASLGGPKAIAVSHGNVCLRVSVNQETSLLDTRIDACRTPEIEGFDPIVRERGGIGLVTTVNDSRVAVIALDRRNSDLRLQQPALVDLALATPGVTHIQVGRRPIDIETSPTGEVAYVLDEVDRDIALINLWSMEAMEQRIDLPGVPIDLDIQKRTGLIAAAIALPESTLQLHPGVQCPTPEKLPVEVGQVDPDAGCTGLDEPLIQVELPGAVQRFELDPFRAIAYVLYSDKTWLSVMALDDEELSVDQDACLDGSTTAPCEVARIPLTYGCSDGLDNDGDGLIDQDDSQCFGPLGAERIGGISARAMSACADGEDNDNDGLLDRDDPDCRVAAQGAEGGEDVPPFEEVVTACSDGEDNDGDGLIDTSDPDCYGPRGTREGAVDAPSFGEFSVDDLGALGYVTHPGKQEVLVVDLKGRRLLQASQVGNATDPFTENLGVSISRRVSPMAIHAGVERTLTRDPREQYAASHALIDYNMGVYVSGDNGFLYYIEALDIACEVWESDGILSNASFYLEPWETIGRQESRCAAIPAEFATDAVDVAPSCEEFILCRSCTRGRPENETFDDRIDACPVCDLYQGEAGYREVEEVCTFDARKEQGELVSRAVNPRFALLELGPRGSPDKDSGQEGNAQCTLPEELLTTFSDYTLENPDAPQTASCGSPLFSQPISATVPRRGQGAPPNYSDSQRIDLVERRGIEWSFAEDGSITEQLVVDVEDVAVQTQEWTITYEGVLPGTRRSDGLVEEGGVFEIGPLDPCLSDVTPGDRFILLTEPGTETGGVPAACEQFATPDDVPAESWREYVIKEVFADRLVLGVVDEGEGREVIGELPEPSCFPRGVRYEIRAHDVWTVSGSVSGIASGKIERGGVCVPGNGADAPRVSSRVRDGERFIGPQISFYMIDGVLDPVRDQSYTVSVGRRFNPASTPRRTSFNARTPAATDVVRTRLFSAAVTDDGEWFPTRREWFLVADPSDNIIVVQQPSSSGDTSQVDNNGNGPVVLR